MYQKFIAKFNNISFNIIIVLATLAPLFFVSGSWGGLAAAKGVLLYVGVFLAFSFWLLAQFVHGSIQIPKSRVLFFLALWVVLAFGSALLSVTPHLSLWGRGFVLDSFATTLVLGVLVFLVAVFSHEQRRLVKLFLASFLGSVLTIFLQVVLYLSQNVPFVQKYLAHIANQGTLVGAWIDFAYFVTCIFVLALLMHEVLKPKGFFKFLSLFALILSLVVLVFLNFKIAWIIAAVSALLVFVYKSSVERSIFRFLGSSSDTAFSEHAEGEAEQVRFPTMSFVALLLGLFFFLSSGSLGTAISQYAGISFTNVRPSLSATATVVRHTLAHDPLFGAGAGRFGDMWALYHPIEINQTLFWNTNFDTGFSALASHLTTNGLLATVALLAVLILSLLHGFKLFNSQFPDRFSRFIAVSSLVMLVAFTLLFILASPGLVLIVLGFMYLGMLIGVSTLVGRTKLTTLNYLKDPRLSFFAILLVVVATMASFSAVFFSGNRFVSVIYYSRALAASDPDIAALRLNRALLLSPNDVLWKARTALFVARVNNLAKTDTPDKNLLQSYFTQAEQSAQAAVAWDRGNASNWISLSQVYQLILNSKSPESYTNAKAAADEAQKRSPVSPFVVLNQARIAFANSEKQSALDYIQKALDLKKDYLDAYVLKAQVRAAGGDTQAAKDEITAYTRIAPFDYQGYLLLAQVYSEAKEYANALSALAQARSLNPNDPTTVLAYINMLITTGNRTDAIKELQSFKAKFPAITGVDEKIKQLQGELSADTTSKTKK